MKQTQVKFVLVGNGQSLDLTDTNGYMRTCKRILTMGNSNESVICTLNGITGVDLAGGLELNSFIVKSLTITSGKGILCQVIYDPITTFEE